MTNNIDQEQLDNSPEEEFNNTNQAPENIELNNKLLKLLRKEYHIE